MPAAVRGRNIDADDVLALLREVYADGIATIGEAEELIAFDRTLACSTGEWQAFFAATVADHVVWREAPPGVVDERLAAWLTGMLLQRQQRLTAAGFAAVMRVVEAAAEVTPSLAAFAIEQIRLSVIGGDRTIIGRRAHFGRFLDSADTALLRRLLVAAGGRASRPISRVEAEAMFDLHDAVAGADNDTGFEDLFFKAIVQHLLAAAGCPVPARCEMLAPDPRVVTATSAFGRYSARARALIEFALPRGCAHDIRLSADESAWLAGQIMRDGRPTAAEYALLHLLAGKHGGIDPFLVRAA